MKCKNSYCNEDAEFIDYCKQHFIDLMAEHHPDKCNKCNKPAEYDTPERLCGEHWAEWFAEPATTIEEKESLYKLAMESVDESRHRELQNE